MPFTTKDVAKHTKLATTAKLKRQWVAIANSALDACMEDGGDDESCAPAAITRANGVVKKAVQEADMPLTDAGQIAKSAIEVGLAIIRDTGEITKERAEKVLFALESELQELGGRDTVLNVATFDIDGKQVSLDNMIEMYRFVEAKMKIVNGKPRPASDFLVVEDSDKPNTWHLPVKVNGKVDRRLMGGAKAALTSAGGHRGNKYEGPGKQAAIGKLKALYKSEGLEWAESAGEMAEVALAESESGGIIELAEAENGATPLKLNIAVIEPGFGDQTDNRYYSADMLRRDAGIFEGVKMYTTNHRDDEKSVRTEVSQVLRCPVGFTDTGAPIAQVGVFDNDFAENIKNRNALGTLDSLHCSILAMGRIKPGKIDGKETNIVEAITSAQSVDWVTRAGAGGHALNLAESESSGGDSMKNEEQVAEETTEETEQVEEVALAEGEQETEQVEMLAESEVEKVVSEINLPAFVKEALKAVSYKDEETLKAAIAEATAEVKKLTGSGKPFGQGSDSTPTPKPVSEAEVQKGFDDIYRRHGLQVMEVAQ